MTTAIVGAGIQGCAAAVELSLRGRDVVLFERAEAPMTGASRWNEGKIHLGYLFANDPSLRTARALIAGSLTFHRGLLRYLEAAPPVGRSTDFVYAVHRDSLLDPDHIRAHLGRVDGLVAAALEDPDLDYLGERSLRSAEAVPVERELDPSRVAAAFRTSEAALEPGPIADLMAARVTSDPRIELVTGTSIQAIRREGDGCFTVVTADGDEHGPFSEVVNAAWESRLALDRTLDVEAPHPWLHRYKLALHATVSEAPPGPSVTIVLGGFGDVVRFPSGAVYLSWYPVGRIATSRELVPPDPEPTLGPDERARIASTAIDELAAIVPAVASLGIDPAAVTVRGGHIVGWGRSDIDDPHSQLHERHEVGVHSHGRYHSIDTGKYGQAARYATQVADRITGVV